MSITINPDRDPTPPAPKKNIFGAAANKSFTTDDRRVGVYQGSTEGFKKEVERVAKGKWYQGPAELANVLESYTMAIAGDKQYGNAGVGATFGFVGHLARRLPSPILFDDENIAAFIFGNNKPTAAVDTSGRMWMYAGFLQECLQEEARDKTMVLPLLAHEYLHIALNHTKRMHNFPPDISNIAKDKVINPMGYKMFDKKVQPTFSDIFKLAHGNCPEDAKYEGLSEETIAKMLMIERRQALEEKGTIRIKNLIIEDGTVGKQTVLTAGKGEIKEYDTIRVTVQDMGMMDKVDTEFDCATLEIDNIDNRLKVRKRPGSGQSGEQQPPDGPITIPTESNEPSKGSGQGKPQPGKGDSQASKDQKPDSGNGENDPGRKSLEDIRKDMQDKGQGQSAGQGHDKDKTQGKGQDKGQGHGQGLDQGKDDNSKPGDPQGDGAAGSNPQKVASGSSQPQNGDDTGQSIGQSEGQDAGKQQGGSQGKQPGRVNAGAGDAAAGRVDPSAGSKIGDQTANEVKNGKGASGRPEDILGGLVRSNPLNSTGGHEVNLDGLNDWLKQNGHEELLGKMRSADFDEGQVERAIEISLKEAEKERLIIGSGYAGGHVEEYMHTVVRPNSIYKVNFLRRAIDFLQGAGQDIASTMDEYGVLTYVDPEDMGMPADDGVYYPGVMTQKPEGAFFVIIDTSGSIWSDKRRLGHLAALALGIKGTKDDMSPDVYIVGADTVVSGRPHFYDEDAILDAIDRGIPLGGGGGTDYALPINQTMAYCKENEIKPLGIIYLGDFEVRPPEREELPEEMPPLLFGGMPHDVVRAETFIRKVSGYAEVFTIEDDLTIDALAAEEKAEANKGIGHQNLNM